MNFKKILSIIIIIALSTILAFAYNASTNLSLRLLEADDDVRPFREDFNYNFELVDDLFDDVSLIEYGYLDGVTSAIQTQLNAKVDTNGTPEANDIARFTDLNTIEGMNYTELKTALALSSDDLSDVASIGMIDDSAEITGCWDFIPGGSSINYSDTPAYGAGWSWKRGRDGDPTYNVSSGDLLTWLNFYGYHTNTWKLAASIYVTVDETPGASDMPGRLDFLTSPDGTNVPVLRMAIDNAGNIKMGDGAWTNYVNVSAGGAMTFEGTASINIPDDTIVKADFADEDWGDMTVSTNVVTIDSDAITYDKMQDTSATDKILGRATAGAGTIEEIACTAFARSILDDADEATFKATVNLEIGTDVLAEKTIGIANDNLLEVDGSPADNDYAKFTANGLEGRSYAELMKDINPITTVTAVHTMTVAEAGTVLVSCAATPYTITLPTASGNDGLRYHFIKTDANYFLITLDGDGAETLNYENSIGTPNLTYLRLNTLCAEVTIVSDGSNWQVMNEVMGQVPMARVYLDGDYTAVKQSTFIVVGLNAETLDIGDNFDLSTWISGTADGTVSNHLQDDGESQFTSAMVGYRVKNTTDTTYAYITAFNDAGDVTLSADIFVNGEGYEIKNCKYVIPIAGEYEYSGFCNYDSTNMVANKRFFAQLIYETSTGIVTANLHSGVASKELGLPLVTTAKTFAVDDEIKMRAYQEAGVDTIVVDGNYENTWMYIRLVSKD